MKTRTLCTLSWSCVLVESFLTRLWSHSHTVNEKLLAAFERWLTCCITAMSWESCTVI